MAWTLSIFVLSLWFIDVTMPYTLYGQVHLLLASTICHSRCFDHLQGNAENEVKATESFSYRAGGKEVTVPRQVAGALRYI
jgi:hypothetical protein